MITTEVLIVGAGSSGLFLANLLLKSGVKVLIVERNANPMMQTRAIGIHPPGLRSLNELNLLTNFEQAGLKVTSGKAFVNRNEIATLKLGSTRPTDCILTIPQHKTEAILRENIPTPLIYWGHEVTDAIQNRNNIVTTVIDPSGELVKFKSTFVIGCDGIKSKIRSLIQADWIGTSYEFHYTMADFPDITEFNDVAAIYLSPNGLTESLPLPGGYRRWVVNHRDGEISVQKLIDKIFSRSGFKLNESECTMHSNFRIHEYATSKIFDGNIILLGDASHIFSPIGGQAMSLHWVHALKLGELISQKVHDKISDASFKSALEAYSNEVKSNAKKFTARAAFNTKMGLPGKNKYVLKLLVTLWAKTPLKNVLAKRFAMRDLK